MISSISNGLNSGESSSTWLPTEPPSYDNASRAGLEQLMVTPCLAPVFPSSRFLCTILTSCRSRSCDLVSGRDSLSSSGSAAFAGFFSFLACARLLLRYLLCICFTCYICLLSSLYGDLYPRGSSGELGCLLAWPPKLDPISKAWDADCFIARLELFC